MSDSFNRQIRDEAERRLQDLLDGRAERGDVARWAARYAVLDPAPEIVEPTWTVIGWMAGADLISTDRPFLYGPEDFAEWLDMLRRP